MAVIDYSSFQNSLMAASAAAAYCFQVYYCHENHLFHPAKGAPQKRDDLHRKKGTLLVPFLRCPPPILMGNGGGTPPPPSLFTGAQSFIAYTMSPSLQRRMIRHFISAGKPVPYGGSKKMNCALTWRKITCYFTSEIWERTRGSLMWPWHVQVEAHNVVLFAKEST